MSINSGISSFNYYRGHSPSRSFSGASNADRFLNESLDDDARAASTGSSIASSLLATAELRWRESLSQRDALAIVDPFRPRLIDKDLDDIKMDELVEDPSLTEDVPMPFRVPRPAPHVIDSLGSTRADCASIDDALLFCNAPSSLETRVPLISERPWTTPEGFICVYEKFFTECSLFFPMSGFLLEYVARWEVAFSQLSVAAIRNAMGLFRLATLCGVTIHCSHFEELTSFKGVGKKVGVFYAQSSGSPKLVLDAKSKTYDWFGEYFFVMISPDSVGNTSVQNYTGWSISPNIFRARLFQSSSLLFFGSLLICFYLFFSLLPKDFGSVPWSTSRRYKEDSRCLPLYLAVYWFGSSTISCCHLKNFDFKNEEGWFV